MQIFYLFSSVLLLCSIDNQIFEILKEWLLALSSKILLPNPKLLFLNTFFFVIFFNCWKVWTRSRSSSIEGIPYITLLERVTFIFALSWILTLFVANNRLSEGSSFLNHTRHKTWFLLIGRYEDVQYTESVNSPRQQIR